MTSPVETSESEKTKIRALFKIHTENELKQQIQKMLEWTKTQNLPKESHDEWYLEMMLLRSQFNHDKAKKRILLYFGHIGRYSSLLQNLGHFQVDQQQGVLLTSLKLTPNFERISVIKMITSNVSSSRLLDFEDIVKVILTCGTIAFHKDYCSSTRFVFDFNGVSLTHFKQIKPVLVFKLAKITQQILKVKIAGIELLNAPHLVSLVLPLAKMALTSKVFGRVTVHENLESLHKTVAREFLPIEYGGELWSSHLLMQKWDELISTESELFGRMAKLSKIGTSEEEEQLPTFTMLTFD